MEAVAVVAIALAALAWVWRGQTAELQPSAGDPRAELYERKSAVLGALVDLDEEHEMGKLSSEDRDALRGSYETEAIEILDALDAAQNTTDPLEAKIAAARQRLRGRER